MNKLKMRHCIERLPPKQQMAIRACFTAAKRKSTCICMRRARRVLLRMRSPKLYEHLCKQKILILPSRTCLVCIIMYTTSRVALVLMTVFATELVQRLDMEVCSQHDRILFDELKSSEQFGVNTAGTYIPRFSTRT